LDIGAIIKLMKMLIMMD